MSHDSTSLENCSRTEIIPGGKNSITNLKHASLISRSTRGNSIDVGPAIPSFGKFQPVRLLYFNLILFVLLFLFFTSTLSFWRSLCFSFWCFSHKNRWFHQKGIARTPWSAQKTVLFEPNMTVLREQKGVLIGSWQWWWRVKRRVATWSQRHG